ncbi:MAG: glycosyltransferase [Anaerolineae bacterium]|nr:glycosyltransferase [Anaerolineae bacterium]
MIQRIAMLSVHTCPLAMLGGKETGGMNVYVRDLSKALSRRGIYVDVYTRSQNTTSARVSNSLAERGRVIHVKAGPEHPYNKNLVYDHLDEFVRGVKAQVEADRLAYDLIYSHYWLSGIAAAALRQTWDIPIVQMFHTLAEMKNRVAQSPAEREPARRVDCEGEVMRLADRLIAATPLEKNQMTWLYGAPSDKINIVPPGVDLERFQPLDRAEARRYIGIPPDHQMILFVGRIQPLKGIDILMRALALVKQRDPAIAQNICVTIIGGDPNPDAETEKVELERLESLRAELGISDLVTFLGAKDQDTLVYYYSAAEMVVMPSHYESFGMVALEAMACGTPIIASDVGGLSFSIEDGFNGYLVPGRNPQALADKIVMLLKYPILREQFGEQARAWVSRYSWVDIADELLDVFADTLTQYEKKRKEKMDVVW